MCIGMANKNMATARIRKDTATPTLTTCFLSNVVLINWGVVLLNITSSFRLKHKSQLMY